jgi:hypothetical protein
MWMTTSAIVIDNQAGHDLTDVSVRVRNHTRQIGTVRDSHEVRKHLLPGTGSGSVEVRYRMPESPDPVVWQGGYVEGSFFQARVTIYPDGHVSEKDTMSLWPLLKY